MNNERIEFLRQFEDIELDGSTDTQERIREVSAYQAELRGLLADRRERFVLAAISSGNRFSTLGAFLRDVDNLLFALYPPERDEMQQYGTPGEEH